MRRILLWERKVADQQGRRLRLAYRLLAEEAGGLEHYGVEILLDGPGGTERRAVPRITPLAGRAEVLLALLARAEVTPTSLPDVLADLL